MAKRKQKGKTRKHHKNEPQVKPVTKNHRPEWEALKLWFLKIRYKTWRDAGYSDNEIKRMFHINIDLIKDNS